MSSSETKEERRAAQQAVVEREAAEQLVRTERAERRAARRAKWAKEVAAQNAPELDVQPEPVEVVVQTEPDEQEVAAPRAGTERLSGIDGVIMAQCVSCDDLIWSRGFEDWIHIDDDERECAPERE